MTDPPSWEKDLRRALARRADKDGKFWREYARLCIRKIRDFRRPDPVGQVVVVTPPIPEWPSFRATVTKVLNVSPLLAEVIDDAGAVTIWMDKHLSFDR